MLPERFRNIANLCMIFRRFSSLQLISSHPSYPYSIYAGGPPRRYRIGQLTLEELVHHVAIFEFDFRGHKLIHFTHNKEPRLPIHTLFTQGGRLVAIEIWI